MGRKLLLHNSRQSLALTLSFAPTTSKKQQQKRHSRWNHNTEVDKSWAQSRIASYRIVSHSLHLHYIFIMYTTNHLRHRITSHIHISNLAFVRSYHWISYVCFCFFFFLRSTFFLRILFCHSLHFLSLSLSLSHSTFSTNTCTKHLNTQTEMQERSLFRFLYICI